MDRFVSALGPNKLPKGPNVKYLQSSVDYWDALKKSKLVPLDEGLTTVIYRLSYDPDEDEFFSWRQDDENYCGNEKNPKDPTDKALAYEIFTAPQALLDADKTTLNKQIDLIANRSQLDRPGPAGPK
jgi:hypothetical protein